jgi:hypothetical protein
MSLFDQTLKTEGIRSYKLEEMASIEESKNILDKVVPGYYDEHKDLLLNWKKGVKYYMIGGVFAGCGVGLLCCLYGCFQIFNTKAEFARLSSQIKQKSKRCYSNDQGVSQESVYIFDNHILYTIVANAQFTLYWYSFNPNL